MSTDEPTFDAPTPDAPVPDAGPSLGVGAPGRCGGARSCSWSLVAAGGGGRRAAGRSRPDRARPRTARVRWPASAFPRPTWRRARGTAPQGRRPPTVAATETVVIASLARTDVEATITVMPGGDATPATDTMRLAPGEQVSVPVADVLATAEPGVVVETVGGAAAVSHVLEHGDDVAMEACTRSAAADWYFASGTTVDESQHDLLLFNPFGDDAIVDVSFVTDTGVQEPGRAAGARGAAPVAHHHPRAGLRAPPARASRRTCTRAPVASSPSRRRRSTTSPSTARSRDGIALSAGATAPSSVWRIPAGSTRDGGRVQLALANFSSDDSRVDVKAVLDGEGELQAQTVRVPAQGVTMVDVTTRVPIDTDVAVTATVPCRRRPSRPRGGGAPGDVAAGVVEHRPGRHARLDAHRDPLGGPDARRRCRGDRHRVQPRHPSRSPPSCSRPTTSTAGSGRRASPSWPSGRAR